MMGAMEKELKEAVERYREALLAFAKSRKELGAARLHFFRVSAKLTAAIYRDPEGHGMAFGEALTQRKVQAILHVDKEWDFAATTFMLARNDFIDKQTEFRYREELLKCERAICRTDGGTD